MINRCLVDSRQLVPLMVSDFSVFFVVSVPTDTCYADGLVCNHGCFFVFFELNIFYHYGTVCLSYVITNCSRS